VGGHPGSMAVPECAIARLLSWDRVLTEVLTLVAVSRPFLVGGRAKHLFETQALIEVGLSNVWALEIGRSNQSVSLGGYASLSDCSRTPPYSV